MPADPTAERSPAAPPPARRRRRRWPAVALVVALVAAAAVVAVVVTRDDEPDDAAGGTGDQEFVDLSGDEIVETAVGYMSALNGARLQRTTVNDGGQEVLIDLVTTPEGDCQGTLGLDDGRAELRVVERRLYLRGDRAFVTNYGYGDYGPDVLEQTVDQWHRPLGFTTDLFRGVCDIDTYLSRSIAQSEDDSSNDKGDTVAFDGVAGIADGTGIEVRSSGTSPDAVNPSDDDDVEPDEVDTTLTIATTAPHYVLSIESDDVVTSYSDFDTTLEVEAPPEDDVIALVDLLPPEDGSAGG